MATSFLSKRNTTRRLFSSSSSSSSARSAGCSSSVTSRSLTYCFLMSSLSRRLLVSISGLALTSSSLASSFSASRMSCLRSSVASSFRSSASFWRTSAGISAGSSCTGSACSAASAVSFFSSISIGRTSSVFTEQEQLLYPEDAADRETKNAPPCLPECRKRRILRTQSRAFLCSVLRKDAPLKRCFSARLSEGGERLGKTQLFLFSDPPRRWFYFDYDPGPFSCVHLQVFIFIFIIAPQKNGVNPKPPIYQNFAKQNTLFRVAAHEKGCFAWILPWCEEESCYLGKRLRPRFPWQKYNSFHN